jgi:non-specific serine/threonine protein kinase/serine/threonine-protein kinase
MGEVYRAEQQEPIRRELAVKLIKVGMDTKQVVARFESERQALALMSHPNIARVHDAGATDQGRPFFVMEYVDGLPITAYCDEHDLTTVARLRLFIQVCEGVQHAHQRGIIHRDIKPSNVLVTQVDGVAVPKIIDFGVAKAIGQRLTKESVLTQVGVLIGTPDYMSPEQAAFTVPDIDTRTDVYSLGVVLYELLIGVRPFGVEELGKAAFDEICRTIREVQPSKPSTRITSLGDASRDAARHRRTDPSSLARELRGDLDWITMKALEKERNRRYDSPNDLAADIKRHLGHEPVVAGPPSSLYRAGKFVRRHRMGVGFAGVLILVLVSFGITMAFQADRIADERDRANLEADTASQVSEFLVGLFELSDPAKTLGSTITAREILDQGADRIERELGDQPRVRARLMHTLGRVYLNLGLYDAGANLLEDALESQRDNLGPEHPATLDVLSSLALLELERDRMTDAASLYSELLQSRRRVLGPDHPDTFKAMTGLAFVYRTQGRSDEAEALFVEALEGQRRVLGTEHPSVYGTMVRLAGLRSNQGRLDEAEALFLQALELVERVRGKDHPLALSARDGLGFLHMRQDRYEDAERQYILALEGRRRVLGDDHHDTLWSMSALANLYTSQGRYDDAEPIYLEALAALKRVVGLDHRQTLYTMGNLAAQYVAQERYDEADPLFRESLEISRRMLGVDAWATLIVQYELGRSLLKQERYDEAEELLLDTFERAQRTLEDDSPDMLQIKFLLARLYRKQGRYGEAAPMLLETLSTRRPAVGSDRLTRACLYELACVKGAQGEREEALRFLQQAVDSARDMGENIGPLLEDPDLLALRDDPDFQRIIAGEQDTTNNR